jgi:hypothetical protein
MVAGSAGQPEASCVPHESLTLSTVDQLLVPLLEVVVGEVV